MIATDEMDTDRALNLLIHDVRAPLSVAQGYLRLLSENRLQTPEDRARALAQTMDALGRIARLCEDASAYAAPPPETESPRTPVEMRRVVQEVQSAYAAMGAESLSFMIDSDQTEVFRAGRLDRLAQSMAVILGAVRRARKGQPVAVTVTRRDGESQFLVGLDDDRTALVSQPPVAFDAWRGGHGIALPLACRTVTQAGGRIWTFTDARGAVGIALPVEASVHDGTTQHR